MSGKYFTFFVAFLWIALGTSVLEAQKNSKDNDKTKNIICFVPEISPSVDEIKSASYDSYFSAVSDRFAHTSKKKMLRVDTPISYEKSDIEFIKEICKNNDAVFAMVSKIKFFKVGLGKYVFSSQVVVSMKLYNAEGELLNESSYDTFRRNARIIGTAENSIKIGTNGAMKSMVKNLKKQHLYL